MTHFALETTEGVTALRLWRRRARGPTRAMLVVFSRCPRGVLQARVQEVGAAFSRADDTRARILHASGP
eukprot:11012844-Heterocapsa_arctica.AAC.1